MNTELNLKLQSYVDGELTAGEARQVESIVQSDAEAKALLGELQMTRNALRGNETEHRLPETREFYWNKIERAILAAERAGERTSPSFRLGWLLRYWPQLSGATVAALLLIAGAVHFNWLAGSGWDEIESGIDEAGTFTFRSEENRMTLVWVSATPEAEPEADGETVN